MKPFNTFRDLRIPQPLAHALDRMDFIRPTPIQTAAIPAALEGKDVLGIAQTGTGKTAAFGIPLLTRIYAEPGKAALVLAPTRELAAQIHDVLKKMSKEMKMYGTLVVGGESFSRQAREIADGVDYIIATPGRLNDHLDEGTIRLSYVSFLVLDEVDRMLDMGFAPQIKRIMKHLPKKLQTLLFSATLPKETVQIAEALLYQPVRITIKPVESKHSIDIETLRTSPSAKSDLIVEELEAIEGKTLIFTRTKSRTERVARILDRNGFKVVNIHGGRTQGQRKRALSMFKEGSHPIMVATDIAGRGIDVSDIEVVVNYDLPGCREDYIHRIGRTGRNGKTGKAINFVTDEDEDVSLILTGQKDAPKKRPQPQQKSQPQQRLKRASKRSNRRGRRRRRG